MFMQTCTYFLNVCIYFFNFFNVHLFLRKRERECKQGRGREKGRHRIWNRLQALSCQHRARWGARTHEPWDRDLNWHRTLNGLSHPGTSKNTFFRKLSDRKYKKLFSFSLWVWPWEAPIQGPWLLAELLQGHTASLSSECSVLEGVIMWFHLLNWPPDRKKLYHPL